MTELKTQKPREERKRTKKVFASLAAVTLVGVAGVAGTTAALSDTTVNEENEFDAAYIDLYDNDSESFMYDVEDQEFGGPAVERCIVISYTGSRSADVGLHMPTALLTGAQFVDLKVEAGRFPGAPPAFSSADASGCTGFVPGTAGTLYDSTLSGFQTAYGTPAAALEVDPDGATATAQGWEDGDTAVFKVTLELNTANNAIPAGSNLSGLHTYTWTADTL